MATPVAVLYVSTSAWDMYEFRAEPLPPGATDTTIPMDLYIYALNDDATFELHSRATYTVQYSEEEGGGLAIFGLGMYGFGGYSDGYPSGTKNPIVPPSADYPNGPEDGQQVVWFGWHPSYGNAMYPSEADRDGYTNGVQLPESSNPAFATLFPSGRDGWPAYGAYLFFEPLRIGAASDFWTDFIDTYEEI